MYELCEVLDVPWLTYVGGGGGVAAAASPGIPIL